MKALIKSFSVLLVLVVLLPARAFGEETLPFQEHDIAILTDLFQEAKSQLEKQPEDLASYKQAGISAHQLAMLGNKDFSPQAVKYLTYVVEKLPDDPVMTAYLGSAYAMQGRDGKAVLQRLSNVNKGIDLLHDAVKKSPDSILIRMVRASVTFELPGMFDEAETSYTDYVFIVNKLEAEPTLLQPHIKAEVFYKLGSLAATRGNQKDKARYFIQAVEAAPDSIWAALAKKE